MLMALELPPPLLMLQRLQKLLSAPLTVPQVLLSLLLLPPLSLPLMLLSLLLLPPLSVPLLLLALLLLQELLSPPLLLPTMATPQDLMQSTLAAQGLFAAQGWLASLVLY